MTKKYEKIAVTRDTKTMLMEYCKEEFLRHHPEMKNVFISHDKMLYEVCRYYLR